MSVKTAHKYERASKLPSQLKRPHTWRSRPNPFETDWPWVVEQLERDPALQATTLFALLCAMQPGKYRPTQLRTLQRHLAPWRALHGPEQEVIFEQVHLPGERAQSDFTHMEDLGITLAGQPFPHLLFHLVLTYSNVEAVQICFGETFEALAEGIEHALWQIGGVPVQHRTDHLSTAIHHLPKEEQEMFSERYQALHDDVGGGGPRRPPCGDPGYGQCAQLSREACPGAAAPGVGSRGAIVVGAILRWAAAACGGSRPAEDDHRAPGTWLSSNQ